MFFSRLLFSSDTILISSRTGLSKAHQQFLFVFQASHKRKLAEEKGEKNVIAIRIVVCYSSFSLQIVLRRKSWGYTGLEMCMEAGGWGWRKRQGKLGHSISFTVNGNIRAHGAHAGS